ncbi:hypothetical protein RDI58_017321 [Solanum bulbocastanum]|uniref:Uncharacterized protein n=1 Tax=Solanum bulbocastanum TaxID=147425 RepID=A0AAN8Y928_SOLBU
MEHTNYGNQKFEKTIFPPGEEQKWNTPTTVTSKYLFVRKCVQEIVKVGRNKSFHTLVVPNPTPGEEQKCIDD